MYQIAKPTAVLPRFPLSRCSTTLRQMHDILIPSWPDAYLPKVSMRHCDRSSDLTSERTVVTPHEAHDIEVPRPSVSHHVHPKYEFLQENQKREFEL